MLTLYVLYVLHVLALGFGGLEFGVWTPRHATSPGVAACSCLPAAASRDGGPWGEGRRLYGIPSRELECASISTMLGCEGAPICALYVAGNKLDSRRLVADKNLANSGVYLLLRCISICELACLSSMSGYDNTPR